MSTFLWRIGRWRADCTRRRRACDGGQHPGAPTYIKADLLPRLASSSKIRAQELYRVIEAIRTPAAPSSYALGVAALTATSGRRLSRRTFPTCRISAVRAVRGPAAHRVRPRAHAGQGQQYQRYLSDADRILILLHNEPDPDAMASGLALRNLLHRTKATAIDLARWK